MTQELKNWVEKNKLIVSELSSDGSDIIQIEGVGKFLYLQPFEGKVINSDFAFELSDEDFDIVEKKEVDYILFEFGTLFYYSSLKRDRNRYNEVIYKPEFNDFKYLGQCAEPAVLDFVHLGVHSEYEILNGSGSCDLWVKKAAFLGCKKLGICDKNTLASSLPFQTACEKKGIQAIIGETISVAVDYVEGELPELFELKLYVLNYEGWKNLLLINKEINVEHNKFVTEEFVYKHGAGLCCVIPKESKFNYYKDNKVLVTKLIAKYKKVFDVVYYQIDTLEYSSQQMFKEHLKNIDTYLCNYRKFVKPILINDSYYLDEEEKGLRTMLNKVAGVASVESNTQYFKSVQETIDAYSEWIDDVQPLQDAIMQGLLNAAKLSDKIDFRIKTSERKLPKYDCEDVEALFFKEVEKGFNEHFGKLPKKEQKRYLEQLEMECKVIVPNGLCDYFMILWDIIKWCRDNNIMVGPGRGSVCGSLVAYCLHITAVDPLKYGLLFSRFLNETRVKAPDGFEVELENGKKFQIVKGDKLVLTNGEEVTIDSEIDLEGKEILEGGKNMKIKGGKPTKIFRNDMLPDIDIDFPADFRDAVKDRIKEKYGYEYTCSIGTYTRMQLRTCIKDFGKVKGLSFDYTNKLTKDIDDQVEYTWGDLIEYASKSKTLFKFVQENPELVHLCKYALLQPKAESVHPSAVVIVPRHTVDGTDRPIDIWEWLPVKKIDGMLVSEWEGKYIDKSGFLKEDILGLSQLDKFQNLLNLIKKNTGKNVNVHTIPFDDEEVFKYFRRGWCEDVFQFGTTGLMNYCRQVKPTCLEDLIAMTALFRPGPMDMNAHQDFADIKNGKKKPVYDFGMEEVTKNTFSLYVYQEQIMKAVIVAGLSEVESDTLRTTIKKKDVKTLSSFGDKFKEGYIKLLKQNNIKNPEEYASRVWDKLLAFSGYGFNKSHAAAYSIISYWCMWFKVNYPLEFWTTTLQFSKESDVPYRLAELKKTGVDIEVRPPDVNFSEGNFTCDDKEQRIFFSIEKIKGVGPAAVENIIKTRQEGGKFYSFEEFCKRVPSKVNAGVIQKLIVAGAFDLVEELKSPRERKVLLKAFCESKGKEFPSEYDVSDSNTNAFWILEQKNLTGFGEVDYESMIVDLIPNKRVAKKYVNDVEFAGTREGEEVTIAGKLIYYKEKEIKNGKMCTLQIDCNNSIVSVLCWPDAYEEFPEAIEDLKGMTVAINGVVGKDKFKNEKKLYSNNKTKLYVLSNQKKVMSKLEEKRNSKL